MGCHVNAAGWEPEPDGEPSLGRKGRRWFRCLAEQRLRPFLDGDEDLLARVVDWYLARVSVYAVWRPADAYLGPRDPWGEWSIPKGALEEDVEIAMYQCRRDAGAEREAERFTTLDEWLSAEGRGELSATGIPEPPCRHFIEGVALHYYLQARARMAKARPRTCPDCGGEFQPKSTTVRRCEACCAAQRTKRERGSQPPTGPKRRQARGDR